jgi:hypothetical protein
MPKTGGQGRVMAGQHGGYRLEAPPWESPACTCGHPRYKHFCAFGRCDLCSCRFFELPEKVPA